MLTVTHICVTDVGSLRDVGGLIGPQRILASLCSLPCGPGVAVLRLSRAGPYSPAMEFVMVLTAAHISPLVALIAGILILVVPQLLNYVVAIYLIVIGLVGLNDIYHYFT
jgi:hypothetical protein